MQQYNSVDGISEAKGDTPTKGGKIRQSQSNLSLAGLKVNAS